MPQMTLADIVLATRGTWIAGDPAKPVGAISTDSRTLAAGNFFIPLKGKRFDGHDFLPEALRRGAGGCVIASSRRAKAQARASESFAVVEVGDANEAYGNIAAYYRNLFFDLSVIGVTGSNGKSTTKEMIAALLAIKYPVLKNEGTLNNLVGVPQTLLKLDWDARMAVLEMGTSLPGEMAQLTRIVRPDVGVVTNVGPSHLEFFGDLDGVAEEKAALAEGLGATGLLVLNADDPKTWAMRSRSKAAAIGFGFGPEADIRARAAACDGSGRWGFAVGETRMRLGLLGRHNILNALSAIAVASHFEIPLANMPEALENVRGLPMRMQCTQIQGLRVINDAYNSNPQSLMRAMQAMEDLAGVRKIVVMGDMLELGATERQAHEEAGRLIASSSACFLIAVGRKAGWAAEAFLKERKSAEGLTRCADAGGAAKILSDIAREGDVVLLKGSRGMRLERVLEGLQAAGVGGH